ncbi:hypothetical protein BDV28DRAFT_129678 [Aspergillus coremiiformis]|uniref:DUF7907 domain-containing protein n=1 Tax=Aspergillus coremiiformis TaxID=138285 RepID=A0A5N6ZBP9_9EURO|nr:hypothetical protein BDV28DRAFT_129678 [Aspergillus coremiiformis]
MKFLSSLPLLVSFVAANPILRTRDAPKNFHLKTTDASNSAHNNLYVYGYHTGAGFNDAVLTPNVGTASPAFLNDTNVQFSLDTPFPWGLFMLPQNNYGAWEPVQINTGYGSGGFSINNGGLQWLEQHGFGGWLVCDWYHNAPQLFYLYKFLEPTIPSSCSKVQLSVEPIS